ncbi:MAG: hypothetical protein PVJ64_15375 [Gemmatimonadales bacterium]
MRPLTSAVSTILFLSAAVLGCPINRPPVPWEYYDFRAALLASVADTSVAEMEGDPAMQDRLEDRLPDLAAILTTDSLVATLDTDPFLWPLASAVAAVLMRTLASDHATGSVRSAYDKPDGQRLAVDAIVIGLGRSLRRLRGGEVEGWGSLPER